MNKDITITNDIASFKTLENLGIKNFFTYSQTTWGHMGFNGSKNILQKCRSVLKYKNIPLSKIVYLGAEHNDNVQILHKENIKVYEWFYDKTKSDEETKIITIQSDAIITKESIPLIFTPGDCTIACLTGIDQNDGKRFIIFLHAGISGTILKIYNKALDIAHHYYTFSDNDLSAFIFPAISGRYYKKDLSTFINRDILESEEWKKFLINFGDVQGIDAKLKLSYDLYMRGIGKIYDSGLDTYTGHEKGTLYSQTYAKVNKMDTDKYRFAVGVYLENIS